MQLAKPIFILTITWLFPRMILCGAVALLAADLLGATPVGGRVVGWGRNNSGQATGGPSSLLATGIVHIAGQPITNAVAIAAQFGHALALLSDGTVVGWGMNNAGQALGTNAGTGSASGTVRLGGAVLSNVVSIAAGHYYSIAVQRNGTLVGWGEHRRYNQPETLNLPNLVSASVGWMHAVALTRDGLPIGWSSTSRRPLRGSNLTSVVASQGPWSDLGVSASGSIVVLGGGSEVSLPPGLTNITAVASSKSGHYLALRRDGTVIGWGFNQDGQATGSPDSPGPLVSLNGKVLEDVRAIAAADGYSMALKSDGTVVAWGMAGSYPGDTPITVPAGLTNISAIVAADGFCLAIQRIP